MIDIQGALTPEQRRLYAAVAAAGAAAADVLLFHDQIVATTTAINDAYIRYLAAVEALRKISG